MDSSFTFNRSRTAGSARAAAAAAVLACAFHSWGVFGKSVQVGLMGAWMIRCICGLTVVGAGSVRPGISRAAGTVCAKAQAVEPTTTAAARTRTADDVTRRLATA